MLSLPRNPTFGLGPAMKNSWARPYRVDSVSLSSADEAELSAPGYAMVTTTIRLRFDGRSTEVIKVTVT